MVQGSKVVLYVLSVGLLLVAGAGFMIWRFYILGQ